MKCDRRTRCSRTLTLPINQPRLVRVHPKKVHISELKCSGWLDDYIRLKRADDGPTSGGLAAISFFQLAQFRIVPLQSSATAAERQGSPKTLPRLQAQLPARASALCPRSSNWETPYFFRYICSGKNLLRNAIYHTPSVPRIKPICIRQFAVGKSVRAPRNTCFVRTPGPL